LPRAFWEFLVEKSLLDKLVQKTINQVLKLKIHLPEHALASSAVARAQGLSKWKSLHFSQSAPAVLCLHAQVYRPDLSKTHREACPLHLQRPPSANSDNAYT
jgi:hypothetical protein